MKVHGSIQENMKEMQNKLAKSIWYFEEKKNIVWSRKSKKREKKKINYMSDWKMCMWNQK